jgi:ParB/RepB/Spo0J family partition protein
MGATQFESGKAMMKEIKVDHDFNPRKMEKNQAGEMEYPGLKSMVKSIKEEGLLQPLVCWKNPTSGKLELVCGFRRYMALTQLGVEQVDVRWGVFPSRIHAKLASIAENVVRENLATYDLAIEVEQLQKVGAKEGDEWTGERVGSMVGKGKGYINKLLKFLRELHPIICEAWKLQHPKCTIEWMFETSKLPQEAQLIEWKKSIGELPMDWVPTDAEGNPIPIPEPPKKEKVGDGGPKHPSVKIMEQVLDITKGEKVRKEPGINSDWRAGVIAALEWAIGEKERLAKIYPVMFEAQKKEEEEIKKLEKEAESAKKMAEKAKEAKEKAEAAQKAYDEKMKDAERKAKEKDSGGKK